MRKNIVTRMMMAFAMMTAISLNTLSAKTGDGLIYNAEEVNGVIVSETVFKMDGNMLTNYVKHNYKYDDNQMRTEDETLRWDSVKGRWTNDLCIRYSYTDKTMTTEYYKWDAKKKDYILVPEMTVTMDR